MTQIAPAAKNTDTCKSEIIAVSFCSPSLSWKWRTKATYHYRDQLIPAARARGDPKSWDSAQQWKEGPRGQLLQPEHQGSFLVSPIMSPWKWEL